MQHILIVFCGSLVIASFFDHLRKEAIIDINNQVFMRDLMFDVNPVIKELPPSSWTLLHQYMPIWNIIYSLNRYVKTKKALNYYIHYIEHLDMVSRH